MIKICAWIRGKPLASFYLITFAITWGLGFSYIAVMKLGLLLFLPLVFLATTGPALAGIIVTAVEGGQGRPKIKPNRTRWITFFLALLASTAILLANLYLIEGAAITPVTVLFALFLLAPPVAFIISAPFSRGTAVRAMMASLVKLRAAGRWLLIGIFFVPGVALLSVAVSDLLGRQPSSAVSSNLLGAPLLGLIVLKFLYQFFFFNGTGEESGWSGFARPRLQERVSPLATALVISLFWVPWHLFLWYAEGQEVFAASYWLESYTLHIISSIIITWLYNRSRGSILVAGAAHAAANTVIAILPGLDLAVFTAMMTFAAIIVILLGRMWIRLPQQDPAVGHAPRLAV